MAIASLAGKIFVHAKTLKEAEFILKLSTKVSKTSYTNCVQYPIHGTGLGVTHKWFGALSWAWVYYSTAIRKLKWNIIVLLIRRNFCKIQYCRFCWWFQMYNRRWGEYICTRITPTSKRRCPPLIYDDFQDSGISEMRATTNLSIDLKDDRGNNIEIQSENIIYQPCRNLGHILQSTSWYQ